MTQKLNDYDERLLQLDNFKNLPETLPFIGEHWHRQEERILFVAESHYVDIAAFEYQYENGKANLKKDNPDLFYKIKSADLTQAFKAIFNTRAIITDVEKGENLKGKQIYTNLKKVLAEYAGLSVNDKVFGYFSIYNYFQRPSYTNSGTIQNTTEDNKIAFETLAHVTEVLKPTIIFFISAKAYNTFRQSKLLTESKVFDSIKVYAAPHPVDKH